MPKSADGRSLRLLVAAAFLVAAAAASVPAGAQEGDVFESGGEVAGSGNAQVVTVAPRAGRLALPVKLVTAGSRIEGDVTRSSAGALDLGLLGTLSTLALTATPTLDRLGLGVSDITRNFALPARAEADSRTRPLDDRNPLLPPVEAGPVSIGGGNQHAEAAEAGDGRGRAEGGALELDLGTVQLHASGFVAESVSSPSAVESLAALGELRFEAFGTVSVLRGLEWSARHELGKEPVAAFRLGSARIGGRGYDTGSVEQIGVALGALNQALAPSGLRVAAPLASTDGAAAVSSLGIAFDDSPGAAMFAGPLYEQALADAVNQFEAALVDGVPETGLAVTVLNVALAAATGRGGAVAALGGVDARMGRRPVERFTYAPIQGGQAPYVPPAASTSSYEAPPPPSPPTAPEVADAAPASAAPPARAIRASTAPRVLSEDVSAILVLALGGGALAALAVADRRRIAGVLTSGVTS